MRRGADGFGVSGLQSCDRGVLWVTVARERSSVVGAFVVVGASADGRVKAVDGVGTLHGALLQVVRLAGLPGVAPDDVQRLVALVSRVACRQTAGATTVSTAAAAAANSGIIGGRRVFAGSARAVRLTAERCFAVIGEFGRRAGASAWAVASARASVGGW